MSIKSKKVTKKSLQKFTVPDYQTAKEELWAQETITMEDAIKKFLSKQHFEKFRKEMMLKVNDPKTDPEERGLLLSKTQDWLTCEVKNRLWEYNHNQITWAISTLIQDNGRMPTNHEIAAKADLSRVTVTKHMKEYTQDFRYKEMIDQFNFMREKVLAKVFDFAVNGNVRAARLYLEITGNGFDNPTKPNIQNNFIQINQVKISQQTIERLSQDQLQEIIKAVTPVLSA